MLGAILAGNSKDGDEVGSYTIILGVIVTVIAVYHFPWDSALILLGYLDLPHPGIFALAGTSVALVLASIFIGLHLSDLVAWLRSCLKKSQKKETRT